MTEDQRTTILEACYAYELEAVLAESLNKDEIASIDIEPLLEELVLQRRFLGQSTPELDLDEIIDLINRRYGNLCYLAYYNEEDLPENHTQYAQKWGALLEACRSQLEADDAADERGWVMLGASMQMKFTPFVDKGVAREFADRAYAEALKRADSTMAVVQLAANNFDGEYYQNEALMAAAADKAFALAKTFYDYQRFCFDMNDNPRFQSSPHFKEAAIKAAELRLNAEHMWPRLAALFEENDVDVEELLAAALKRFDTTQTYTFRKAETVTDVRYYEMKISGELAKLYQEDEDAFWEHFEDNGMEDDWDFVNDRVGDPDTEYKLRQS